MAVTATSSNNQRILVAIDGGTPSEWAAQVGRQLAEQLSAMVRLVHVVEPTMPLYEDYMASRQIEARRAQFGLDLLKRTRVSFSPRLETDTVLRTGLAFEEIVAEAQKWKATLIVVGTHCRNRLADLVLGSTADAVLRRSPCPVIGVSHEPRWITTKGTKAAVAVASQKEMCSAIHAESSHS